MLSFHIADLIEHAARALPEREALVAGAERRSYRELDERAGRLGRHLLAAGIRPGEHVGIHAHNCAAFVESMLAAYKIRAVPINVNYRYVEEELFYLFDDADLCGLIFERRFAPRVAALRPHLPKLRHLVQIEDGSGADPSGAAAIDYEDALAKAPAGGGFEARSGDDLYLLYTGGTTGMPKGVMWRQHDVIFALGGGIDHATGARAERPEDILARAQGAPATTFLVIPPLMHGAAQWATLGALFAGNRVVLYSEPSFDADAVWRLVEAEKANTMSITGDAMARPLADALERAAAAGDRRAAGARDVSSLVVIASSAAVFSPAVKQKLRVLLPNLVVVDSIGASESGFNGTGVFAGEGGGEGVVRVAPNADTTVLDERGEPTPPGVVGRLARRGNVPLGYYKDEARTAATFMERDGVRWAIPGDFARIEPDGTLLLLGRGSVCINSGGEKIFPEEVEAALKAHPAVFDAVVVGLPDARFGEHVTAVVQPRPGARPTLEALAAHCRGHLAGYKVPRELHLTDQIRRQPSGKPDYPWARRFARQAADAAETAARSDA